MVDSGKNKKNWKPYKKRNEVMTAQAAAKKILSETGEPMRSREIARIALSKGDVTSASKDPVFSIATTIEKNIRENRYNTPKLVFIHSSDGRKIGLPSMINISQDASKPLGQTTMQRKKKRISMDLPDELYNQIQLAKQAKLADDDEGTISLLLKQGLSFYAPEIKKRLMEQLESL